MYRNDGYEQMVEAAFQAGCNWAARSYIQRHYRGRRWRNLGDERQSDIKSRVLVGGLPRLIIHYCPCFCDDQLASKEQVDGSRDGDDQSTVISCSHVGCNEIPPHQRPFQ